MGDPIEEEHFLRSTDQTRLFVRRFRPPEGTAVRARVAWVHGFAEHGARYHETLSWFATQGVESAILDLRGHGRSDGRRTYVRRFGEYLDDLETFWAQLPWRKAQAAQGADPEPPLFVAGHSMGGLVTARTLQARYAVGVRGLPEVRGALICSPFLGVAMKLPAWKSCLGRLLSRVAPWTPLPSDLDVSLLSKDPQVGQRYLTDPLVVHSATARWYTEALKSHERALESASKITLPAVVIHGDDDGLAELEATERFFQQLGSQDKEFKVWPGGRHELLNEVERAEVRAFLLAWIEARL